MPFGGTAQCRHPAAFSIVPPSRRIRLPTADWTHGPPSLDALPYSLPRHRATADQQSPRGRGPLPPMRATSVRTGSRISGPAASAPAPAPLPSPVLEKIRTKKGPLKSCGFRHFRQFSELSGKQGRKQRFSKLFSRIFSYSCLYSLFSRTSGKRFSLCGKFSANNCPHLRTLSKRKAGAVKPLLLPSPLPLWEAGEL